MLWTPAAILNVLRLPAMPALSHKQPPPHYDLLHHLLYHTLYGVEPLSWAANSTASRGEYLSPFLQFPCCWAQHLTLHLSNGDCSPTRPAALTFTSLLPSLSLSILLLCSKQGWRGEGVQVYMCGGSEGGGLVCYCIILRRETIILR